MEKLSRRFEKIVFWLTVFLFVFIPLYPKFPLINIKGTFVAVRIEDLLIMITVGFWVGFLLLSKRFKSYFYDSLNQVILLFFFIGALSLFSAIFITHTVEFGVGIFHYLRRIELMILLPIVVSVVTTKKRLIIFLVLLSVIAFIVNIYALGQQYLNWPVISTGNSEFSKGLILYLTPDARANSTFAGHYDLAVFLTMYLVSALALFFYIRKVYLKLIMIGAIALSFFVLVLTAARVSFIAVLFGMGMVMLLTGRKIGIFALFIGMLVVLVYPSQLRDRMISTVTVNILDLGQRYVTQDDFQIQRSRLNIPTLSLKVASSDSATPSFGIGSDLTPGEPVNSTELGVYRSFAIRLEQEWPRAIRAFIKNPFFGTGYSSLGVAVDNDFLRLLGEVGLLGMFAFLAVVIEVCKRIWYNFQSSSGMIRYFTVGVLGIIFAFLLNGLFIDVFEASKVASLFWMICGLGLATAKLR
ncbi:hypothetical protein C4577_01535 [Candidatus Parcubacteria bacterium]|nr:MAG: hypothetical protein C4577_01535 [Candidatus Parcubacteria bacterium]